MPEENNEMSTVDTVVEPVAVNPTKPEVNQQCTMFCIAVYNVLYSNLSTVAPVN